MSNSRLYDLVLENGIYVTGYRLESGQEHVDGLTIVHSLPLGFWQRLPVIGAISRNMWAKSRGAQLYEPPS